MTDDSAEIFEMLNKLKDQLPNALQHHKDTVEIVQMMLKHRGDMMEWLDNHLGTVPNVKDFIKLNRDTFSALDKGYLDSLNTTTQFLALWEKFLTATTLTLPRKPWFCPKCRKQNAHWDMRCIKCGEPRDLWADDFTTRA
jgi:hypothetical protein